MSEKNQEHSDRCCNPYNREGHKGRDLRPLSKSLRQKFPNISQKLKICWECRRHNNVSRGVVVSHLSKSVSEESQSDISMEDLSNSEVDRLPSVEASITVKSNREKELEEMLDGLKLKFASLSRQNPLRLSILTIAPDSWTVKQISKEFNCSWQLAKKSKELKEAAGVLGNPDPVIGQPLSQEVVQRVVDFYNCDTNSRLMSGKKDVLSVKDDSGRSLQQKRLLLMDLRGLFLEYREKNEDYPLSFSKFAMLRPKQCVLAGASGTHSVCVCTIHQNCKLLLDAINIQKLTADSQAVINSYKDCLSLLCCQNPTDNCYLDECNNCPGIHSLLQFLKKILEEQGIYEVRFGAWTGTDRSTLLTQILSTADFLDELGSKLLLLKPHSFIAKSQSQYFEETKLNLVEGEVLTVLDFSENYKYIVQDASQAFHFNNTQCTVFPVVCYYQINSKIHHESFVFLSDSTKHDTAAVYTIQKMLIPLIRKRFNVKKIIYFSDGAKQHFKNKYQMINLVCHNKDFGVKAEWHCHATAHGKAASDGVGALFKREAARNSLLCKPCDAILSPDNLLKWGQKHFKTITTLFYSKAEHDKVSRSLRKRFDEAPAVPQILKSHSFTLLKENELLIKRYSNSTTGQSLVYTLK